MYEMFLYMQIYRFDLYVVRLKINFNNLLTCWIKKRGDA